MTDVLADVVVEVVLLTVVEGLDDLDVVVGADLEGDVKRGEERAGLEEFLGRDEESESLLVEQVEQVYERHHAPVALHSLLGDAPDLLAQVSVEVIPRLVSSHYFEHPYFVQHLVSLALLHLVPLLHVLLQVRTHLFQFLHILEQVFERIEAVTDHLALMGCLRVLLVLEGLDTRVDSLSRGSLLNPGLLLHLGLQLQERLFQLFALYFDIASVGMQGHFAETLGEDATVGVF